MKRDAQTTILQACARFVRRQLDPVLQRLGGIEDRALTMEKLQDSVQVRELVGGMIAAQIKGLPPADPPMPREDLQRKIVTEEDVAAMVNAAVAKAIAALPVPANGKDGEAGPRGKDADPVDYAQLSAALAPVAAEAAAKAVADLPKPERGPQGEPGEKGADGRDADPIEVKDVVSELIADADVKALLSMLSTEAVAKHFEANPVRDGRDGERGPPGEKGERGAEGVGVADLLIDREGALVATMTDGRMKSLGPVVGKDGDAGRDGKDGRDGADFTDVTFEYDGERTLTIRGKGGDIVKRLPIPIGRGYWSEGKAAEQGDVLTHDGTSYIAIRDTKAKPCKENSEDWRIMARKGRDGKDGRNGIDKTAPVKIGGSNA
jgi:hypothetical protein